MSNLFFGNKNTELSDDDFTDEELAIMYGTGVRRPISCEEDREEKALEEIGAYQYDYEILYALYISRPKHMRSCNMYK